jgi:hypothetical protein
MSHADPPRNAQVTAFLFSADGMVRVAVEDAQAAIALENSDAGAAEFAAQLTPHIDRSRPPFFCLGTDQDANLSGVLFEELLSAPIPRFIIAQPLYLLRAKALQLRSSEPTTLLKVYRELFPVGRADA